jgi:hypothetical protein
MAASSVRPVLVFDWNDERIQQIAKNIYHAQKAGWPAVLTYDVNKDAAARRHKRRSAMEITLDDVKGLPGYEWLAREIAEHGRMKVPTIRNVNPDLSFPSRDEYPFACTREHTGKAWIGHVSPKQNSLQGYMIGAFLKENNAKDGFVFEVRVDNVPRM